jgi:cell division protein FtsN
VPRDYKHRAQSPQPKRPLPGWLWLLTGLALGTFVWALFWLHGQSGDGREEWATAEPDHPPQRPVEAPASPKVRTEPEPRFDFYHVLPNDVLDVPRQPPPERAEPRPSRPEPATAPTAYTLQVGSFRQEADADRRKAELTLLGFDVRVLGTRIAAGDLRYRVFAGPYRSQADVREARRRLTELGFDTLVLSDTAPHPD